jgi:hypothetical protein
VIFSDSRFKRNNLGLQLNWTLSENDSLGFSTDWNHVYFNESTKLTSTPFYNFDQYGFSGTYKREVTERFGIFAAGGYRQNTTDDPRDISDSKGFEFSGGVDGAITPLITGQFSVGVSFDHYPGSAQESAKSVVFRGGFGKEITERSQVSLSLSRASNLSYFQKNAYFVTTGIGATYSRDLRQDMALSFSSSYQRNGYPLAIEATSGIPANLVGTERRRDSFVDAALAVRYRYNDWLAMDVHFDAIRRNSNIPGFRLNSYRAGINLLIGSRGFPMGRSPY